MKKLVIGLCLVAACASVRAAKPGEFVSCEIQRTDFTHCLVDKEIYNTWVAVGKNPVVCTPGPCAVTYSAFLQLKLERDDLLVDDVTFFYNGKGITGLLHVIPNQAVIDQRRLDAVMRR